MEESLGTRLVRTGLKLCLFLSLSSPLIASLVSPVSVSCPLLASLGIKFIIIADTRHQKVEELLRKIYELYSDYVLKNPFYSLDMPIRWDRS